MSKDSAPALKSEAIKKISIFGFKDNYSVIICVHCALVKVKAPFGKLFRCKVFSNPFLFRAYYCEIFIYVFNDAYPVVFVVSKQDELMPLFEIIYYPLLKSCLGFIMECLVLKTQRSQRSEYFLLAGSVKPAASCKLPQLPFGINKSQRKQ